VQLRQLGDDRPFSSLRRMVEHEALVALAARDVGVRTPRFVAFANAMPNFAWDAFQWLVLILEIGAPIWFVWRRSRPVALVLALGMHAMIGLMFGPVKWFAMLMMVLLLGGYLPETVLAKIERALGTRFG